MFDSNNIFALGAYTLAAFNIADCTSILQVGGTLAGTSLLIYGWFNAQRQLAQRDKRIEHLLEKCKDCPLAKNANSLAAAAGDHFKKHISHEE